MSFCLCILHIICFFFQFCMSFSYVPVSFRHRRAQMLMEFTPSSGPTPMTHPFPPYMLCTWGTPRVAVSVDGTLETSETQRGWNRRSQASQPCCCACTGNPRISDGEAVPCRRSKRKSCQMKWCLTLTGMSFYDLGIRWPAKKHMKSCGQHWHPVRIPTVATDIHMSAPSSMCPAMSLPANTASCKVRLSCLSFTGIFGPICWATDWFQGAKKARLDTGRRRKRWRPSLGRWNLSKSEWFCVESMFHPCSSISMILQNLALRWSCKSSCWSMFMVGSTGSETSSMTPVFVGGIGGP